MTSNDSSLICPICNFGDTKDLYTLQKGNLIRCKNCQTIFFFPRPSHKDLQEFYCSSEYRNCYSSSLMNGKDFAVKRYNQLLALMKLYSPSTLLVNNKTMLDVGCGEGDLLSIASQDNWDVSGTEISFEAANKGNKKVRNKILVGDLLNLNLTENSYDLITIYHVIEHLIDPIGVLKKIHGLLKPGGIVFVETPNIGSLGAKLKGKNWSHITPPEHITYFNPVSLEYTLSKVGFENHRVFTNTPHVIGSTQNWNPIFKFFGNLVYEIAPQIGMGAALQALAIKEI